MSGTQYDIRVKVAPVTGDIQKIGRDLKGLETPASSAGRALADGFRRAGRDFTGNTERPIREGLKRVRKEIDGISSGIRGINPLLKQAFAIGGITLGIRGFTQITDAAAAMHNQLLLVAQSGEEMNRVQQRLYDIALRTARPIEQLTDLYVQGALASDVLGASQEELFMFLENVGIALDNAGGNAGDMNAQITQLARSLSAGEVSGRAFITVLTAAPGLAQAIADSIDQTGGSVARLRAMIEAGDLSGKQLFDATVAAGERLRRTYANALPEISDSLTNFRTELIRVVGGSQGATAVSTALASAIDFIARNLNIVIPLLAIFIAGLALQKIVAAASAIFGIAQAFVALTLAMARNPIVLLATVAAIAGLVAFRGPLTEMFNGLMGGLFGTSEASAAVESGLNSLGTSGTQNLNALGTAGTNMGNSIATAGGNAATAIGTIGRSAAPVAGAIAQASASSVSSLNRIGVAAMQTTNQLIRMQQIAGQAAVTGPAQTGSQNIFNHGGTRLTPEQNRIPARAGGGGVGGKQPYLVGEQGPEIIFPSYSGFVATAAQTKKMAAAAGMKGFAGGGFMGGGSSGFNTSGPSPFGSGKGTNWLGEPSSTFYRGYSREDVENIARNHNNPAIRDNAKALLHGGGQGIGAGYVDVLGDGIAKMTGSQTTGFRSTGMDGAGQNPVTAPIGPTPGFQGYATTAGEVYANPNVYGAHSRDDFRVPGSMMTTTGRAGGSTTASVTNGRGMAVDSNGGAARSFNITLNIHGVTDADSFRRSETQITAELAGKLASIQRDM